MKTVTLAQIYKDLVIKISDIVEQNGGAMTWAKVPDTKNIFIEIKIDTLGQGKIQFSKLTQENQAVTFLGLAIAVGIAVGACCLVAAAIIYYCNRPSNSLGIARSKGFWNHEQPTL
ncbi:hypothetical protein TNCT_605241 [Trichonephila clavata]|uniref:Uncharacterized protein n=1 Tax=Trichonephila clavata TaxID=2740835 RepID=A0A8X6K1X1_TRICU|nr:hypothetical protein TNCT_605241 [Trichonephila clavata]